MQIAYDGSSVLFSKKITAALQCNNAYIVHNLGKGILSDCCQFLYIVLLCKFGSSMHSTFLLHTGLQRLIDLLFK